MARRTEAAPERACECCGNVFQPWKVDGRFCSKRCTQSAARKRRLAPIVMRKPDSHDLAWAAGFFDGEGCVRASPGSYYETSDGRRYRSYLRLDVSQKDRTLLDRLGTIFGAGSVYYQKPRPTSSEGHKWVCNGRDAFYVASLLWPWLGEQKKSDFKRAIKAIRETRNDFVRHPQRGRRRVIERS